jgi:Cu+-exporting ATPase
MDKDVVCGMQVDPRTARFRSEHNGKIYYFCSAPCKAKFDAAPAKFAK